MLKREKRTMNQLKVRSTIGDYDKLTLSLKEIAELSKQFKNTRIARKHTQTRVGSIYQVSFQIISDWEHSLRVTPFAVACMRDYIEGDISKLEEFILEFQKLHFILSDLLPIYYLKDDNRFELREKFLDKLLEMKLAYYSLKDFDKMHICKEMLFFLDIDANHDLILILYHSVMRNYRNFLHNYYIAFVKAQKSINALLDLYGISKCIVLNNNSE